ncbi:MAG: T9SS type A sorting domain-containing protein [Flavobacteriales bacterium]
MNGRTSLALRLALLGFYATCYSSLFAQVTWRRTYGGFGSDDAQSVRQTTDGGYIISGSTGSFGGGSADAYVVRVDEFGDHLWSRTYGALGVEVSVACRELTDGFIIAGSTSLGTNGSYDMMLIRTDELGNTLWEKNYGTADWDLCRAIGVLPDGFVLGGISYGAGSPAGSAYVVRTDLDGDTLWTKVLGGSLRTECSGLTVTDDQGLVLAGVQATASGYDDGFLTKLNAGGGEEWTTVLGSDSTDYLSSVVQTTGGDLIACGGTRRQSTTLQIYVAKVFADGALDWERYIGSGADAGGTEIRLDHNGGFVFTGYNSLNSGTRDMILTVTDGGGWFQFGNNYGDGEPADGYSIDPTFDGGFVVAGWCENYGPGLRAMYVVKTDGNGQTADLTIEPFLDPVGVNEPGIARTAQLFPNPIEPGGTLTVRTSMTGPLQFMLSDLQGRIVVQQFLAYPGQPVQIPVLANGIYDVAVISTGGDKASTLLFVK